MSVGLQPFVNDETVALAAPTQVWSAKDGQLGAGAIHGVYHADWRYISKIELTLDGRPLEWAASTQEAGRLTVQALARSVDDDTPDPRVLVRRERTVEPGVMCERVRVCNGLSSPVVAPIKLSLTIGLAELVTIKSGQPVISATDVCLDGASVHATDGVRTLRVEASEGEWTLVGDQAVLAAVLHIEPGAEQSMELVLRMADPSAVVWGGVADLAELAPTGDASLDRWAKAAIADCRALLLDAGQGAFPAAGAPWFFTLFGRDSLIAARFLLPVSLDLAHTTLATLAARQGMNIDAATAEQPGKILHELRAAQLEMPGEGISLPPVYFGTIDATGLWIILLHDAWRAGLGRDQIETLLPTLEGCLGWLRDYAAPDESGYLKYIDATGHGLANQGWKDSGDSIRFFDGTVAEGPIALAEVQAQACLAAECGAALFDEFGGNGAPWRAWAEAMRERFRRDFWVERHGQRFPAIALDGAGRRVDSLTSNIGQLIGTTLLSADEERALADLLIQPRFASGFGLRTMADSEGGYWPLSYHCGTVWTHDTAVAIEGMLRAGLSEHAKVLATQLVCAADAFGSRMPELFGGFSANEAPVPVAYPASCRPQAWAAAAVVPVHRALTASEAMKKDASG